MHRNVARVRCSLGKAQASPRCLFQNPGTGRSGFERNLLRADLEDPKYHDEVLLYEERLSRPQRRRNLKLNTYGRKIEKLMNALLKL
jgi:hypothetical protein